MQEVAERAAVGLGTIYRRWPTKGDLIVAALKSAAADMNHEYTPDLDGLRDHLKDLAKLSIKQLDLLPGLVAAAHRDPEIAEALRASWLDPRLAAIRATVEVVPPTPLRPGLGELIAEVGPALLMMRALVTKEPLDDEVVDQILDDLVIPLLAFHGGAGDGPSAKDRQRSSAKSTRTRRSSQPGQGSSTRRRADRQGN
jgi:AcrR family transcriptional regulator